jgi:hypothetical protein
MVNSSPHFNQYQRTYQTSLGTPNSSLTSSQSAHRTTHRRKSTTRPKISSKGQYPSSHTNYTLHQARWRRLSRMKRPSDSFSRACMAPEDQTENLHSTLQRAYWPRTWGSLEKENSWMERYVADLLCWDACRRAIFLALKVGETGERRRRCSF